MSIMVRMIRTRRVKMMMMMMMMMMTMTVIIVRMKMMMIMMMKMRVRRRVKMMMMMMMTSFLDKLWMTSLKLLRSIANSVFHFSYLRCRPPRTAYLDKKECRSITTHRSRSH